MRKSIKVARSAQLLGALCFIAAIVSGANGGLGTGFVGGAVVLGLLLLLGGKVYEWLTKE